MRFHWGWIEPVLSVPYVPTLGPVRPHDPLPDLFEAVVANAGTGVFLPYDKDRRWSDTKTEHVLADAIEHGPELTLVPTYLERGAGTVKVHVYGARPDSLSAGAVLARNLAATLGAGRARIVWFSGPDQPEAHAHGVGARVQLKDFARGPGAEPAAPVGEYKQLTAPAQDDFASFADQMAADGFTFLHQRMRAGTVGPVLTVLHEGRVAGAIGPMETMNDPSGTLRLLPQYFGVRPEYRGHGYGRSLWRAAMQWGHQHGAAYQLLQTEVGGASDRLCAAEGLTSLGFVNQRDG
ncbi:GNAT family N-acetyltransferase [Streptomyces sp. NPDC001904]|uniref:GNAT family N-acetyltransferase n=1 Tax=Streptomyces sp. NPDC001904 TaxID=3154531 RepID=UPI003331FFBB